MKQLQLEEINILEANVAWALEQAKKGDRESLRWLQDCRLEGNEAASKALVELALSDRANFTFSLA
jgi:hypothetical protein